MKKTTLYTLMSIFFIIGLFTSFCIAYTNHNLTLNGSAGLNVATGQPEPQYKVDATLYIERKAPDGTVQLVGAWTKQGIACVFGKLTGLAAGYNMTQYAYNITGMSIGNKGTLNSDSTILPGEWMRVAVTAHDYTYNSCNFTGVFQPTGGPYTADCFGLNIGPVVLGADYSLIAYDEFNEVTGIDSTFTITGEFRIYSTSA